MKERDDQLKRKPGFVANLRVLMERKPILATTLRILIALTVGLVSGGLTNPFFDLWSYLALLSLPFGIIGALIVGVHNQHPIRSTLGVSALVSIGFCLGFVMSLLPPIPATGGAPTSDPSLCSPCLSMDLITFLLIFAQYYFVTEMVLVTLTTFAMSYLLKCVWHNYHKYRESHIHERVMSAIEPRLLWLALLAAVLVLFPFDWLSEVWPALGRIFDLVFVSVREHMIGHIALFWLAGLLLLCSMPSLRRHPLLYTALMALGAVGEEFLQALSRWKIPNAGDGRDLACDVLGFLLAYLLAWTWWWLARKER